MLTFAKISRPMSESYGNQDKSAASKLLFASFVEVNRAFHSLVNAAFNP